ncbi:sce7726 family protein [Brevibacterium casei]|uniref:sce7726 family protein n=1 Tax=Brevibacterium casei TaxID=33889 RepID=UPI001140943E
MVRDTDVRRGLRVAIESRIGDGRHLLVPEVDIRWTVPARADALLIGERICGFEIKSDVDSLARLPRQVEAYGQVVERAYLVVGERHLLKASEIVPPWWHIWSASWRGEDVQVRETRRGRLNPAVNPVAVTSFLSRAQLTSRLSQLGETGLSSKTVDELRLLLVGRLGKRRTISFAREGMLDRVDWQRRSIVN